MRYLLRRWRECLLGQNLRLRLTVRRLRRELDEEREAIAVVQYDCPRCGFGSEPLPEELR